MNLELVREVEIESLNIAGDGVAGDGRTPLTVPFTLPGERVRVRLEHRRAGTVASLVDVLHASPHRVQPACRHFGPGADGGRTCGGCTWQHISYAEQLRLKTALVTRLVRERVPSAPAARPALTTAIGETPWHYRNKVHFVLQTRGTGGVLIGHYARGSRRLVPVRECPVHDERGNRVAFALRDACSAAGARAAKGIAVRCSVSRDETMATLVVATAADKQIRTAVRRVRASESAPTAIHVNLHPRDDAFIFGRETRHLAGPERLREDIAGASFLMSPTSFFQTNVQAAALLVREVVAAVPKGAHVLDLYAGAGLFALPLALAGCTVVAVEENRSAVADGEASRRLSRVTEQQCRFIAQPVESALASRPMTASASYDAVVLDPPREGCDRAVVEDVFGRSGPPAAVYVSCDPQSLARDLGRITRAGYMIESMQPVDMFPHTPHVETIAVLRRTRR